MSGSKRLGALCAIASLIVVGGLGAGYAADPTPADLVDALNGVFGKHQGVRAAHTKGICATGLFTPSPDASTLTKAPQFAKPVPIIGRFSLGGGNPEAPDNAKDNVRGLALRFDLGGGASTDLVTVSAPVFFVKSPDLMVELLKTLAAGDQDKVKAFFAAHPESTRQAAWLNSHPVPASYAGVDYWGVHAFTLTNAAGEQRVIKFKVVPEAGELGLSDEEAKAKGPDFYQAELTDRLAKGPVVFDLEAILGQKDDPTDDPTMRWDNEDSRPIAPLGKISIDAITPNATCDAFSFLPGNLADGVPGPANDAVFQARSSAYVVSLIRRKAQ